MSIPDAGGLIQTRSYDPTAVRRKEGLLVGCRMLHGCANRLKSSRIPEDGAAIPIRGQDACFVWAQPGVSHPMRIDELRNLFARSRIPETRGVIKGASKNSFAIRAKGAAHDAAHRIEILPAMPQHGQKFASVNFPKPADSILSGSKQFIAIGTEDWHVAWAVVMESFTHLRTGRAIPHFCRVIVTTRGEIPAIAAKGGFNDSALMVNPKERQLIAIAATERNRT